MRRLIQVVGHLESENAATPQQTQEPRQQGGVIGQLLQDGVREDEIDLFGRLPSRDVRHLEAYGGKARPRRLDHGGRRIDPEQRGRRKAACQKRGRIAGAAAEIDDIGGGGERNRARRSRAGRVLSSSYRA